MEDKSSGSRAPGPSPQKPARRMAVRSLLQNSNTLILEHQGQDYILRVTRNGKLILTK